MTAASSQTILVVDDDPQIRKLLRVALELAGYAVVDVPDGRAAMARYCQAPADLVICDLIMPEKEGIETIADLRKLDPTVKIIAISGGGKLAPQTYLDVARSLGATETMTKPVDIGRLTAAVHRLLRQPAGG